MLGTAASLQPGCHPVYRGFRNPDRGKSLPKVGGSSRDQEVGSNANCIHELGTRLGEQCTFSPEMLLSVDAIPYGLQLFGLFGVQTFFFPTGEQEPTSPNQEW